MLSRDGIRRYEGFVVKPVGVLVYSVDVLIKVDAAVGKLAERSLSLQLCCTIAISRYPIFLHPFVALTTGFSPHTGSLLGVL